MSKLQNLVKQQPKWNHLPTKATRVPEIFVEQVEKFAHLLDNGSDISYVYAVIEAWDWRKIQELEAKLPALIANKKEVECDRALERAITYLAERCDYAYAQDGAGFNAADAGFGHWLAGQIKQGRTLLRTHAQSGLKMASKYIKQLERGGLSLPEWDAIAHQYPENCSPVVITNDAGEEELAAHRVEIKHGIIAVYAPYDPSGKFQQTCKSIKGWRFEGEDRSWRFPLDAAPEVMSKLVTDEFCLAPEFAGALALAKQEEEEKLRAKQALALEASHGIVKLIQAAALDQPLVNGWYLRDYQKKGVEWLLAHRRGGIYQGGILADQMGLGKSLEALVAARAMQRVYDCPVFVIAPVSLQENWMREAQKAETKIEFYSWAKLPQPLENKPYVLICDEAHYMQSGTKTKRGKEALALAQYENCLATWLLSVAGETPVVIKDNDRIQPRIQVMTMAQAVEFMGLHGEGTKILAHHERFFIRSFDQQNNCMRWSRVYGVQAHYSPEPLITIKAQCKTVIRVTKGHSLYIFREGKIIQPQAEYIKPGDYLIKDACITIKDEVKEIDLTDYIELYNPDFQNYVIYGDFGTEILMQKSLNLIDGDTYYNWVNNGKHGMYMTYEAWRKSGYPLGYTWIASRKGSKGRGAKPIIPVKSIAWLVGYVTGDGWATKNRLCLAIANNDLEAILARLHQDLDNYFDWGYDIRQYRGCVNLRINCKPLSDIFYHWFGGQKAYSKRLPSDCFTWDVEARKLVLEGLVDSDGYSETIKSLEDENLETTTIMYTSTSKMLLEDIKALLLTLGVESAIYSRKMSIDSRPGFENSRQSYTLRFCIRRIESSAIEKQTKKLGFTVQDAQLLKVQEVITNQPTSELVYDFAVEDTENFVAAGVVCHNTGTPLKNGRPINLFPLLQAVGHPLGENQRIYELRYCNGHRKFVGGEKMVWDVTGSSYLEELAAKTEDVILRRTKDQCLSELPPKTRLSSYVELDSAEYKAYQQKIRQLVDDYRRRVKLGLVDEGAEALVTLNILRNIGSQFKVNATVEKAQELLEQGQQVVIFTEFVETAKAIALQLDGLLLTGETKPTERMILVDRFQSGDNKVFVGTIKAGGVGLTLTAASNVILTDRPWTPGDCEQAEDRTHRLGQQNAVFATWMQLGQIDEAIDSLVLEKQERIELVLKGKVKTLECTTSPQELAKQLLAIL